jgi:glycosyltransferase involved in cell wall biosynthesis
MAGSIQISQEEFRELPIDIAILMCHEQERGGFWQEVSGVNPKAHVVHYAGNDHVPYNAKKVKWLLSTNERVINFLKPPQHLLFYPVVPYSLYLPPMYDRAYLAKPEVRSFINDLPVWRRGAEDFKRLSMLVKSQLPEIAIENMVNQPRGEVSRLMNRSLLVVHFKDAEGYGFSVLEAMAQGVPVITTNYLLKGRTLAKFFTHKETGWIVNAGPQAIPIIKECYEDRSILAEVGMNAAARVREIVNEEEQTMRLKEFLERAAS